MIFCYVPCPDMGTAEKLAEMAVTEQLAACANIQSPMTSIYKWQGQLEKSKEILLILKSTSEKQLALQNLIETQHPYEVPCIAFWQSSHVNESYLEWVQSQLSDK